MKANHIEAMKLALEALAVRFSEGWYEGIKIDASDIMLLNDAAQALAEQPVQQEFVAHCEGGPEFCSVCHKELNPSPAIYPEEAYEMGLEEIAYYTSPPAQRTWVGLTEEDENKLLEAVIGSLPVAKNLIRAIEAKLKEKNT